MIHDLIHNLKANGLKKNAKWAMAVLVPGMAMAQITPTYKISTFAGNYTGGFSGDGSAASSAALYAPFAAAVDKSGNVYIADQFNNRIRKVTTSGTISTVAGNGTSGYTGDGSAATSAELSDPEGIAVDSSGNLYIADTNNCVVRKVTSSGTISTIAGNNSTGCGYAGDGASATAAQINHPSGIIVDAKGNIYFADTTNNIIRIVTTNGNINTYAGNFGAGFGFTGDGGPATSARLNNPEGLALDSAGNLYIADGNNNRVRVVTAATGVISTVAGSSLSGFSGDGGPATKAKLTTPKGVALDSVGNLYIADTVNSRIRIVSPAGIISTVAGNASIGSGGDGQLATTASLYFPSGVAVDTLSQNIYVVDNQNNVVRLLTVIPATPTIFPNGVVSASAFGTLPGVAPGSWIEVYGTNLAVNARGWGSADFSGVNAPTSLDGTKVTIGGQAAFVDYISAGQVNAQVPSGVTAGSQQLTVTTPYGTTSGFAVNVSATQPGILAPISFKVGGNQYAAALFSDGTTYVAPPGSIPGVTSRQAKPGEVITIYGVGFGIVTPNIPAGQTVLQNNTVASPVQFSFGGTAATSNYSGLAPQQIGLYQFNVVVPNVPNSDLVPLTFTVSMSPVTTQTLFTAVHN